LNFGELVEMVAEHAVATDAIDIEVRVADTTTQKP
jgi:hypothetical protein